MNNSLMDCNLNTHQVILSMSQYIFTLLSFTMVTECSG